MKNAILISCFNWYKIRLEPVRALLIEQGYNVTVITSDFNHINKNRVSNRYVECTYINVPEYRRNLSFQRIRSHWMFGRKCKEIIEKQKPDLIYCLIPPNKVVDYCADYKKKNLNTKFIIDIIDLWPESMPLKIIKNSILIKFWSEWRNNAISVADYVFTECNLYREKLAEILNPEKTSTLYLYKEQSDEEQRLIRYIIKNRKNDGVIRFAYLGSMNNIIDISGICGVIQKFINAGKKCELHAIGDGESRMNFEKAVQRIGCQTYFYGKKFDEMEKIRILAPCDYAFNMMKGDVSVGLTIKSIDYVSYGLPLINNIKGDTWGLVEEKKIGMNIGKDEAWLGNYNHEKVLEIYKMFFNQKSFLRNLKDGFDACFSGDGCV